MGTSLTLFRIHDIDVKVHWSFLLILVYGAVVFGGNTDSLVVSALYGVLVTLLLFLCVTLHEFGHAAVAKYYRIRVPSITLLPIGGVASLEKLPEKPSQEFFIAIAGPAVNIVLAFLLALITLAVIGIQSGFAGPLPSVNSLRREMMVPGLVNLLVYLVSTNLLLAFFNLLPAFPMDGGRILRALLAMTMSYVLATRIAVYVGRAMAVIFAVLGIFGGGVFLLLIAFFVYVGGSAEREAVEHRSVLRDIPTARALKPDVVHLYTSERIGRAVDLMMQRVQTDFSVLDLSGAFAGVLTRPALVQALREQGEDARIVDVMVPAAQVPVCSLDTDLSRAWETMAQSGSRVVAVMDEEKLMGLITLDDITEVIHIANADEKNRGQRHPGDPSSSTAESKPNAGI